MDNKIGEWTILDNPTRVKKSPNSKLVWTLQCSCGNTRKAEMYLINELKADLIKMGYAACRKCKDKRNRTLKPAYTRFNGVYTDYKHKALVRNTVNEFSLTKEDAYQLFSKNCYYCNLPPSNVYLNKRSGLPEVKYSGIDRLDSSKGYTVENTVPCCKQCNYAKLTMTEQEFYAWINRVYLFKVQRLTSSEV